MGANLTCFPVSHVYFSLEGGAKVYSQTGLGGMTGFSPMDLPLCAIVHFDCTLARCSVFQLGLMLVKMVVSLIYWSILTRLVGTF